MNAMHIGVPRESAPGEHRVALTPETIGKLRREGRRILVERRAGVASGISDAEYDAVGAEVVADRSALIQQAQLICQVRMFPAAPEASVELAMCVLASGSTGNCTALIRGTGETRRLALVDAGLSPRRTSRLLAEMGLRIDQIDDVLFTHLDRDHCVPTWARYLPPHARFRIHRAHRARAERTGMLARRTYVFDDDTPAELPDGMTVHARTADHDESGVAVFRFHARGCGAPVLGYATDIGRVTDRVIDHLRGVHTLAIESNYCPELQRSSGRPAYLIDRITGGAGHLSNEESAEAVRAIDPTGHSVLLHLSRQCNTPERARAQHAGDPIISRHDRPTGIMPITRVR